MTDTKHQRLATRLHTALQGLDERAILRCFDLTDLTLWFGARYASAYELPSPIYLVLDNSLIQAFKHRQTNAKRAIDALAFESFCAFVRDWSDREVACLIALGVARLHATRPRAHENEVSSQANVSEANVKPRSGGRGHIPLGFSPTERLHTTPSQPGV